MTDVININSLKSNCDCHKNDPAPRCSCGLPSIPGDQFFKVKNYFSELKKEWQKAEARANLGITEIVDIKQTKFGEGSGDENVWTITFKKGDNTYTSEFKVLNGKDGAPATITLGEAFTSEIPVVINAGTPTNAILKFGIPKGERGEKGEKGESGSRGLSAYEIYLANGGTLSEPDWLESLKGKSGKDGTDGTDGSKITSISIVDYKENATKYYLDNQSYTSDMFIWRIALDNNTSYDIWVPKGGVVGPGSTSKSYEFMYKKVHYNDYPTENELLATLLSLQQEVNTSGHGKSVSELRSLEWKSYAEAPGTNDFIFLATAPIENEVAGTWSVIRLTPRNGDKGDPGPQGPQGPQGSSGDGSEGKQGLSGPVIRMRGNWQSGQCYVNLSAQQPTDDTLRFIDVVYYLDTTNPLNTGYYKVRPTNSPCVTDVPTNGDVWEKAQEFDFMFVDTLIAQYLSANYVDADEVRIHDRGTGTDIIVAGMTSGKSIGNEHNDAGDVRIWAGTTVNILDLSKKDQNGKWHLNVQEAPFKVLLNGHLFASDADIEGIVLANTLRLGKLLNIKNLLQGTFLAPKEDSPITLPKLVNDRVQLFYLLTNLVESKNEITVNALGTDLILESGKTNTSSNFKAKYEKLYILFGMDVGKEGLHTLIWFVVELDMRAASSIIPGVSNLAVYGEDYTGGLNIKIRPNDFYNNKLHFNIELDLTIRNLTDNPLSVLVPFMLFSRKIQSSYGMLSTMEGYITVHFTQIFLTCVPKKTTGIFAALEDDGISPGMEHGGQHTTILYETGINLFEEIDDSIKQAILNGTWSDTTPEETFDGFTADSLQTQLISLDYLMPGIIVVKKQGSSSSTQLNSPNNSSNNSLEALMSFYQDLGITITDNETEQQNND